MLLGGKNREPASQNQPPPPPSRHSNNEMLLASGLTTDWFPCLPTGFSSLQGFIWVFLSFKISLLVVNCPMPMGSILPGALISRSRATGLSLSQSAVPVQTELELTFSIWRGESLDRSFRQHLATTYERSQFEELPRLLKNHSK